MSEQGIQPNEHTAGLLISDLVRKGDRNGLLAAEDLMKEMKRMGMMVGVVPWTSLIGGYYRGGWLADAKQALARMKGQRVELNRVGYNMLLREAGRIASRPPSTSIPHSRWMRPNANQSAIRDMLDQNAQRSADLAQQVYQDSTRRMADTMLVLFQEMDKAQPRVEANADTYTIMLQALVQHQRMEEADWVLGKMREHGYTPEKATLRTWVRRVEGWQGERRRKEAAVAKGYSV
jgi:pentatricopeptide repeat protein